MNKDKMYKDMIETLKDTLKEVCEKHDCMECYDGCMTTLETIADDAQQTLNV